MRIFFFLLLFVNFQAYSGIGYLRAEKINLSPAGLIAGDNSSGVASVQQNRITVKGVVTDKQGEPVIGANILEKGTGSGTITNFKGEFSIDVSSTGELFVSYVGYVSQTISVAGKNNFVITLEVDSLILESVVVTAMGITKKEVSLAYSVQQVGGDELVRAKDINLINTLAGKTTGVQITKNSSGLGGSAKVSIRGSRSVSGNNQPLYVIDGVPMLNNSNEQAVTALGGTANAGNRDGGDGISNLNPDDVETINILKGASAAALYGTQAANGVILITTKSGKTGIQRATFTSGLTVEKAIVFPKFQNMYGLNAESNDSWGDKSSMEHYDNIGDFFQTGVTAINSVSLTGGNEKMQTYFSYAHSYAAGIVEKNNLQKHNLNFRETVGFFDDRLKLDANINLLTQSVNNRPTSGGYYMNPLVGLYAFPRGEDLGKYKNEIEILDEDRNMNFQSWYRPALDVEQNPYWIVNRIHSSDKRTRAIASLTANLKLSNWLRLQARGTADYTQDQYNQKMYASTAPVIAGNNGRYIDLKHTENLYYADIMALFKRKWSVYTLSGVAGSSINRTKVNSLRVDSGLASLYYPNVFTVSNIVMSQAAYIDEKIDEIREIQSVFAMAQLGWKESVYLDLTGRNDWSSTLAYTKNTGFFYPSVGASWILSNTTKLPDWISFARLRSSWARVGNDLPVYISNTNKGSNDIIGAGGAFIAYSKAPFEDLKPEMSSSYEIGGEWKFFDRRLGVDFTIYRTNTKNQLFILPSSAGAEYKYFMVNAGNIQNQGIEIMLGGTPLVRKNFRWESQLNYSTNENKVKKLHPDLKTFVYGEESFSSSYSMRLVKGGSFGDIYGKAFERDENGKIVINAAGLPNVIGLGNTIKVGNSNPDFILGWSNTFTYKDFSFYFLIDGRFGGDMLSQTQAELDLRGVSKNTGDARYAGYVNLEGNRIENVQEFYALVGGRTGCTEYYMYDASTIRLREVSLGYSFPKSALKKTKVCSGIQLSLIARNLFFISNNAPFDPDAVLSTGNDNQGIDVFGMPTTRSVGFNLKFTF